MGAGDGDVGAVGVAELEADDEPQAAAARNAKPTAAATNRMADHSAGSKASQRLHAEESCFAGVPA